MLGVTSAEQPPPAGEALWRGPSSSMYYCLDSRAFRGGEQAWGRTAGGPRCRGGDRVGLLVGWGRVWVFVNGTLVGPGPMAAGLPSRVRFAVETITAGAWVRAVGRAEERPCRL
jgi:hypothetical protein